MSTIATHKKLYVLLNCGHITSGRIISNLFPKRWWYFGIITKGYKQHSESTGVSFMGKFDVPHIRLHVYFVLTFQTYYNFIPLILDTKYSQTFLMSPSKGTVKYGHISQVVD